MKRGIVVIGALLWLLLAVTQSNSEMKITPDGVTFPNASTQTMASSPPWSQKLEAAERFELVLRSWNGVIWVYNAVLDKETGLVWQRNTDDTERAWVDACTYCYQLSLGGRKGWRLPTIEELASLVDPSQTNPALPVGHLFTNVKVNYHWSSSTHAGNPVAAWYVDFYYGYVNANGKGSRKNKFAELTLRFGPDLVVAIE